MKSIHIHYPESMLAALNLSPESFEEEARMAMAAKFYEMGKLSSGQAAALAGLTRVAFLLNCPRYGVASVEWDAEEIDRESSIYELNARSLDTH